MRERLAVEDRSWSAADDRHLLATRRVRAETAERIERESVPLSRGTECVAGVRVAGAHRTPAANGVVGSRLNPRAPLGSWIVTDLPNDVDDGSARAALAEDDRVVAIEPAAAA